MVEKHPLDELENPRRAYDTFSTLNDNRGCFPTFLTPIKKKEHSLSEPESLHQKDEETFPIPKKKKSLLVVVCIFIFLTWITITIIKKILDILDAISTFIEETSTSILIAIFELIMGG